MIIRHGGQRILGSTGHRLAGSSTGGIKIERGFGYFLQYSAYAMKVFMRLRFSLNKAVEKRRIANWETL